VSLFLDGRYAFSLDQELLVSLGLHVDMELDDAGLRTIVTGAEYKRALDMAMRLLAFRSRSRQEVAQRLQRRGIAPATVTRTLGRLDELGLLDDTRFAQALARDRLELGRKGKRQIAADLFRMGVAKPIVEKALSQVSDEEQVAQELLQKVNRRYAGLEPRARYRRLHDLLVRRGFSFEVITRVLADEERRAGDADQ